MEPKITLNRWWSWYGRTKIGLRLCHGLIVYIIVLFWAKPAWGDTPNLESSLPKEHIEQQLNITSGFETNRTMGDRWTVWGIYQLEYDTKIRLQTGLSYNTASSYINAIFIEFGYEKINDSNCSTRLKFLGNQYGEYNRAANSIIAYLNWDNSIYYIDAGLNFRFLNVDETQLWNIFHYDTAVSETIFYYRLGRRFPMVDGRNILTLEVKNCDPMYAGNLGTYRLSIADRYILSDRVALCGSLEFWQSGGIGLAATYYKTAIFCGIEVKL